MKSLRCLRLFSLVLLSFSAMQPGLIRADQHRVLVVVGAGGSPEYAESFDQWATAMQALDDPARVRVQRLGVGADRPATIADDRQWLRAVIEEAASDSSTTASVWLVLLGHGTFNDGVAKFNLVGPDVSADELRDWIDAWKVPAVVINATASSGAFMDRLSGPNRVIVTATRNGDEENFARFGQYVAQSLTQLTSDLDHDGAVSALEVFLAASKSVQRQYESEDRLSTEHAILDDNGDRVGTTADVYVATNADRAPEPSRPIDGALASRMVLIEDEQRSNLTDPQRRRIDELLDEHQRLRSRRGEMDRQAYLDAIEPIMIEIAQIEQSAIPSASP